MRRNQGALAICLMCLCVSAGRADDKPPDFATLVERLKKGDFQVDFAELRMAYTRTAQYNPFDDGGELRSKMREAYRKKDWDEALRLAEELLSSNYVDAEAHLIAWRALKELKKDDEAAVHQRILKNLMGSIAASGDGLSPATALVVISPSEKQRVLGLLDAYERKELPHFELKGEHFDPVNLVNTKTKEDFTIYFNVTTPWRWREKRAKE